MRYEAIIFDWDGTLMCTPAEYICKVVNATLQDLGFPADDKFALKFWFESGRDKLIESRLKVNEETFWKVFHIHDTPEHRAQFSRPYDDADVLEQLKQQGYLMGILTGADPRRLQTELAYFSQYTFHSKVHARSILNGIPAKPHPQGLEMCLAAMNIKKEKAVIIGNSDEDILCGRAAGVRPILIDRGEYSFPGFEPDIHSLYELSSVLD